MTFAARLSTRARLFTATLGLTLTAGLSMGVAGAAHAETAQKTPATQTAEQKQVMLKGATTASYYWDDASGRNGDTGLPASGKPM
ncbi:hypothetical protein ACFFRU_32835, partial [Planobispora longispora]